MSEAKEHERPSGVIDLLAGEESPATGLLKAGAGVIPQRLLARRLFDLSRPKPGDNSELLKTRFLCRGGGALLVGQTGQGKSSLAMQAAIHWAAGLSLFDITPNGPLRVLLLQGENDDGDLSEARDGVAWEIESDRGESGTDDGKQEREMMRRNVFVVSENSLAGDALFDSLGETLGEVRPDLLIIDPAFSYVDGDAASSKDVGRFLRQGLNPLLLANGCGALVIHHTAKPPGQKGAVDRSASAYAGHGSAEWANWARAVLTIEGIGGGRYKLHAAKRGGRLGWRNNEGESSYFKVLEHSTNDAGFSWKEVTGAAAEVAAKASNRPGADELFELVPTSEAITKEALILRAQQLGIGANRARSIIGAAVGEGDLHEWKVKAAGRTRPFVKIARFAQPDGEAEGVAPAPGINVHG